MLKFNSFRSQRYLRTRFIEGTYLLASEGTDLELELIDFAREVVRKQVGDVAIGDAWKVVRDGQFSFIITPGEAWYDGLPFANRSAKDQLVSGDSLSLGIVPPLTTIADVATGEGKRVTLAATTTSAVYRVVITAEEKVITNIEDKFLKNANISEPTAQKMRLVYVVNVVPETSQINSPVPYKGHDSIDQNLVNEVTVNVAGSGSAGSQVSSNSVTGSEQIDGRDLEIIVVNVSGANPLPKTIAAQSAYAGGKLIDSIGSEYHIVSIINNPSDTSNQEIIRIDKEVGQSDPILSLNSSYRIVKRDVYSTDDVNGTPIGKRFWPIAKVDWEQTVGIVHSSAISDMRTVVEKGGAFQKTTHTKFDLRVADGGTVKAEPKDKATGNFTITSFSDLSADVFDVNGVAFTEGVDFGASVDEATTALALAVAINNSPNPLVDGIVIAQAVGAVVNITAVAGGLAGNSITLSYTDNGTAGATVSGATLSGGTAGISGQLTWSADFDIINPHSTVKFSVDSPGEAVLLDKGSLAYFLDYSALVDTIVSKGNLSVTRNGADTPGTTINLTGAPNLVNVRLGNTIRIHGTNESVAVTAIDDIAKTIEVSSSVSGTGAATIYLDTYAPGTLPVSPETFVLAVKTGGIIQITGGAGLESGESTAGAGGLPTQLLTYIGTPSETDDTPDYSSTVVVGQGDSLTVAIGDLDQGESDLATYIGSPDPNDTTPAYFSNYYVTDGNDLTTSIGALDAALDSEANTRSTDDGTIATYIGSPSVATTAPDYTAENYITDGDSLTTAIDKLDVALDAEETARSDADSDISSALGSAGPNSAVVYSSTNYVTDGTDTIAAIGALDAAISSNEDQDAQNLNMKFIGGGTWKWNSVTEILSWTAPIFVQVAGYLDTSNEIATGQINIPGTSVVVAGLNRTATPTTILLNTYPIDTVPLDPTSYIIARRSGSDILVGGFRLKDGEQLELDGALAEINRKTNQLRLKSHESALNKVRIDAADITQLDTSILSQELSELVLSFTGAVINFTSGAILKEDDSTALGINFTPFSIPVGEYFWYGISLVPNTTDAQNRMIAQVQVLPATAANAVAASAPLPPLSGDKKLGAVQIFNNAGSLQVFAIRKLGTGSGGGGSGTGDSSSITETIKNTLVDSTYELVTPIVASIDKATKFSTLTGVTYDLTSKTIKYAANAQVATSINMIDTVELPATDIAEVDLHAFWSKASGFSIPTAFTYDVSRDGSNYQTVTMSRVGTTEVFTGTHRFADTESLVSQASNVTTAGNTPLNVTTEQTLSQRVNLVNPAVIKTVDLNFTKTGSPLGSIFLTLVKNSGGLPSTALTDVVATGNLVPVSSITTGVNTLSLPTAGLASGLYHVVVNTDSLYKASFSTGVTSLNLVRSADVSTASTYNGTIWAAAAYGFYHSVVGRVLDLRTRVTSAGSPTYPCGLTGLALYYNKTDFGTVGAIRKTQRFVFNSVADNLSSFTLTAFTPDPDLLTCYYVEAGQVFKAPAFTVNGNVISFAANSFNNGGVPATVTLIFDQNSGGSFDNSDSNALLLAANFLGSTNGAIDKSSAGRGIFLRAPNGTLREIAIDNFDNIVIYSV